MKETNLKHASQIQSNYDLKTMPLEVYSPAQLSVMTAMELDARRTSSSSIPASKFSLEVICGASCEVGAL